MRYFRPRILIIASFPPPVHGAAMVSQQIKDSASINEAFCCDYINIGTSRNINEIGQEGILLTAKKGYRFVSALLITVWHLIIQRYDLCYCAITCYGKGFIKDAPFVLLCKLFGRKVVIHQHNKGMANYADKPFYHWLLSRVYRNTKVILLSRHLYKDISAIVPPNNVMFCPNGIAELEHINTREKANQPLRILFLSNLIESKGVYILLDALQQLVKSGERFVCSFVGGESKEIDSNRFVKEVKKRELENVVTYEGKKYFNEKLQAYHDADIFVFPTYYANECFPLVLLEAMQNRLPCISTDEGGIPDIVIDGMSGFIVQRRSVNELADKIRILLHDDALRRSMGSKGYEIYCKYFTQKCFEQNFMNCIRLAM